MTAEAATLAIERIRKRTGAGVVPDDARRCQDAGDDSHDDQDDDEQKSLALAVTTTATSAAEQVANGVPGFRSSLHGAVGVVRLSEGVPGSHADAGGIAPTPSLGDGVNPDHQAGEQNARQDDQVAEGEAAADVLRGEQHRFVRLQEGGLYEVGAEEQDHQVAPGEAARRHDPPHPRHEAGPAAHVLGLDPDEADDPSVPPGNREVQNPHDPDEQPRNLFQGVSPSVTELQKKC